MKRLTLAVLSATCFSGFFAIAQMPADACTPHPDNPDGCDDWPPRRVKVEDIKVKKPFPWPGPVCLSCPPNLVLKDQLIRERFTLPQRGLRPVPQLNEAQLNRGIR